jgi:purine-binding chemotaxis protein CheW
MYLVVSLGQTEYALPILRVREIIPLLDVELMTTKALAGLGCLRGAIDVRGTVIPVVDMGAYIGLTSSADHEQSADQDKKCIILIDISDIDGLTAVSEGRRQIGALVDTVSEVIRVATRDVIPTEAIDPNERRGVTLGIATTNGKARVLLDLDRVFGTANATVQTAASTGRETMESSNG